MKAISLLTASIVFLMFTVNVNAFLAGNESDLAYSEGAYGINGVGPTIGGLIARGGGSLFQACSAINIFFNKIELSELYPPSYRALKRSLNRAIVHMKYARATYLQLKNLAAVTPYNPEIIYVLINFDYDSFQQSYGLFPSVMEKVKDLLSIGDVTGVYNEFYLYTGQILQLLYTLKQEVNAGIFPTLSIVWSVNQQYSEFKLFGQYVTQVFHSIK